MNQRIRELKEEALVWAIKNLNPDKFNENEWGIAIDEKFAELILQECFRYLNDEAERLASRWESQAISENYRENFMLCAEKCLDNIEGLKEHFGMK